MVELVEVVKLAEVVELVELVKLAEGPASSSSSTSSTSSTTKHQPTNQRANTTIQQTNKLKNNNQDKLDGGEHRPASVSCDVSRPPPPSTFQEVKN